MKKKILIVISILSLIILIGCNSNNNENETTKGKEEISEEKENEEMQNVEQSSNLKKLKDEQLTHVHGMGYIEGGNKLLFGTHAGLRVYKDDEWYETTENINDYMGFSVVDQGFYTSGHPGAQSDLPNPIGLQRSFDGGQTLESVGFEGKTDFHFLAVGYKSHDIFLYNPSPNSKLEQGFYLSQDDGESWESINASNVEGDYMSIAVHPSNSDILAIASVGGIYLSEDGGKNFELLTEKAQGVGVFFNESTLFYSTYKNQASLTAYQLQSKDKVEKNLPDLGEDAPVMIAQNLKNLDEFAIYTYVNENVFISKNDTKSWKQISESGRVQ
ncbi:hypothetical protein E3U55_01090 [Filobacillus milosensis]|uniref:Sortilin N-terminal domain-containing protein n=1 Tax=Filobacillus milosensis TaxID=94137 RepID=A0A4Y8IUW5_9BACI|nr:hypothetical protein [Filobacillus milosensis]TFB25016.1 hypothetical protein E3U55_01090 [Filobacillus milosensis]